jgi:predicted branched-subunit amino acid permease
MFRDTIFVNNKNLLVCKLQYQYYLYWNTYTAAGQVGSRQEGMGSSHGLDMNEAFVGLHISSTPDIDRYHSFLFNVHLGILPQW